MLKQRTAPIILTLVIALVFAISLTTLQSPAASAQDQVQNGGENPRLQVAHLAPFAMDPGTAVTVTLDGSPVLTDFEYGDSTSGYVEITSGAGTYLVEIFPAGSSTPAITGTVELMEDMDYTAIANGDGSNQDLALAALVDDNAAPASGKFKLRAGHFAPFASGSATADIRLQDGSPVLTDVDFGTVSGYLELDAGTYDLKITTPGGGTTLIDPMPVTFNDGDIVSVFAAGDGSNQDLGVFAIPSGSEGFFLKLAGYLQVAHLAPFAMDPGTAVTVTIDSTPVLTNTEYGDSTAYLPVIEGMHLVEIFPAGSMTPAITGTVDLEQGKEYTAIATGDGSNQDLALVALLDDNSAPASGNFKLRAGHFAPFASGSATADIRLQDGTPVLTDVDYSDVSPTYLELPAGTYDLKITTPGGATTLIDPMPVTLTDGDIMSVFATGDGSNQDLGVFALPSGSVGSFLDLAGYLQVAHLAPFAMDPGTAVTVTIDATPALTDFEYGDSTAYLPVVEGMHLVEIFPAGSATPAITGTVDLEQGKEYTAIATGDGSNQNLALVALLDDNAAPTSGYFKLRIGHFAPFASGSATADIRLQDGTPVLTDVGYGDVTPTYLELPAGTYDLKITTPGGATTLIDPFPVTFSDGDIFSVFATGDGNNQDLGVFALPSGQIGFFVPVVNARVYMPMIFNNQ